MAGITSMMQQYLNIKAEHQDCIVFFRLGDFYEMFFDDAKLASRELELTLTGRDCGLEERAPMCGVPYHACNTYVERLIAKGYKVAICEQLEDPATTKGLVKRDVVRIITAGTVIDPAMLDERTNNFLLAVCFNGDKAGLALADVSTGEFTVHEIPKAEDSLADEIARIQPIEIICNDLVRLRSCLNREVSSASEQPGTWFQFQNASDTLCRHFELNDLSPLGLSEEYRVAASAAGALMRYLSETQKNSLEHITELRIYQGSETMLLDRNTRRNLELTESLRSRTRKGSLLWLLDKTSTAMGGRLLRSWIEQPLINRGKILHRLDAVEEFTRQHVLTMTLAEELQNVYDIERLLSRVAYKSLNARDCLALGTSLSHVPGIKQLLSGAESKAVQDICAQLDTLEELTEL
ncbi:MAG: DNA mismatch repair protein MutS, partial [Clostridia bacterium]|nr:DNA mismatch repair protein MutS [Clostridia bacterium]